MSNENPVISDHFADPEADIFSSSRSNILAIAEGLLLLGSVAMLEQAGLVSFAAWPVHPYFFVVILLSAQYGVLGGVLTAMGATALSYFSGWPARPFDMSHADYFLLTWADPLSWVLAALMVGIVTSYRGRMLSEQSERLRKAIKAESLIVAQYQILAQRTHKLERSLAGRADAPGDDAILVSPPRKARDKTATRTKGRAVPSRQ